MGTNGLIALLPDMAVFVLVVERGSFSAAARQLGMTPSALSRQVARLESALGVRLLERTTRQLRLTEVGRATLERCRSMLDAADEAVQLTQQQQRQPQGRVRISMPKAFGRFVADQGVVMVVRYGYLQRGLGIVEQLQSFTQIVQRHAVAVVRGILPGSQRVADTQ